MKIQNKFAELIKNGKKTIEIRKIDSMDKILNSADTIHNFCMNALLKVNMEIIDCEPANCELMPSMLDYDTPQEYREAVYQAHIFPVIFNGYLRVKVSELKEYVKYATDHFSKLCQCDYDYECNFQMLDYWFRENVLWLIQNEEWLFNDYLKDEEYFLIYFIDKEETLKEMGKE